MADRKQLWANMSEEARDSALLELQAAAKDPRPALTPASPCQLSPPPSRSVCCSCSIFVEVVVVVVVVEVVAVAVVTLGVGSCVFGVSRRSRSSSRSS
eukprot:8764423-Pyramimonas_sp.AAC.1